MPVICFVLFSFTSAPVFIPNNSNATIDDRTSGSRDSVETLLMSGANCELHCKLGQTSDFRIPRDLAERMITAEASITAAISCFLDFFIYKPTAVFSLYLYKKSIHTSKGLFLTPLVYIIYYYGVTSYLTSLEK